MYILLHEDSLRPVVLVHPTHIVSMSRIFERKKKTIQISDYEEGNVESGQHGGSLRPPRPRYRRRSTRQPPRSSSTLQTSIKKENLQAPISKVVDPSETGKSTPRAYDKSVEVPINPLSNIIFLVKCAKLVTCSIVGVCWSIDASRRVYYGGLTKYRDSRGVMLIELWRVCHRVVTWRGNEMKIPLTYQTFEYQRYSRWSHACPPPSLQVSQV